MRTQRQSTLQATWRLVYPRNLEAIDCNSLETLSIPYNGTGRRQERILARRVNTLLDESTLLGYPDDSHRRRC